jgi:serine/threonine protein kinase
MRLSSPGSLVALKKMRIKKYEDGLPSDIIRELECNKLLVSDLLVRLQDYFTKEGTVILVYEYMPSDLHTLLSALTKPLFPAQVKSLLYMLLLSVRYCHNQHIMHRVREIISSPIHYTRTSSLRICSSRQTDS